MFPVTRSNILGECFVRSNEKDKLETETLFDIIDIIFLVIVMYTPAKYGKYS